MKLPGPGKFSSLAFLGSLALLAFVFPLAAPLSAQTPDRISANDLVRQVVHNEEQAQGADHSLWTYRRRQATTDGARKSFLVCETKDGEIERLVAVDDHPISAAERKAEDARIHALLANPGALRELLNKQRASQKQALDLIKIFPDAFLFKYDGMQNNLVRLNFSPNPDFHGSGMSTQVFRQMAGVMLIDDKQLRIAEIDGQLSGDVKFGGGVLGHLDKGGIFTVKLQDVGSGHWEMTSLDVRMNGKILLFKSLSVRENEFYENFRPLDGETTAWQANELMIGAASSMDFVQK